VSCVLRAIGTSFDVDAFLKDSELKADPAFHRGEPKLPGRSEGPKRAASGFNVGVGEADSDDLAAQIRDATEFFEQNAGKGWRGFADIVGLRRERVVPHSQIKRPESADYQGGHEPQEGYSEPAREGVRS